MRRTLVRLATATTAVLGAALVAAGPAAAREVPPPPTDDHDCRVLVSNCHPGLHLGWENKRNVGG